MHFKLNWIFIDGIHFKRIENWLHNGSRKTQKHDVNLTLNECHRTIRYQKKGNELRRVFAAVGASSFFSSFKRNVISFFWNSLSIWWKKRTRRKKCWTWFYVEILIHGIQLRLILYWTLCHAVNSFATDLQCVLIVALQKTKIFCHTILRITRWIWLQKPLTRGKMNFVWNLIYAHIQSNVHNVSIYIPSNVD